MKDDLMRHILPIAILVLVFGVTASCAAEARHKIDLQLIKSFDGPEKEVRVVGFLEQNKFVFSIGRDGVYVWETESAKQISHFGSEFRIGASIPDTDLLVTGGESGELVVWNWRKGQEVRKFKPQGNVIYSLAILPDPLRIVSGNGFRDELVPGKLKCSIVVWDFETGTEIKRFDNLSSSVLSIEALPDGKRVLSCSFDMTMRLWNIDAGEIAKAEVSPPNRTGVADGTFCPMLILDDARSVIAHNSRFSIPALRRDENWNFDKSSFGGETIPVPDFCSIIHLPKSNMIASGHHGGLICVWDVTSGNLNRKIRANDNYTGVTALGVSGDGTMLISAGEQYQLPFNAASLKVPTLDKKVRLWRVEQMKQPN